MLPVPMLCHLSCLWHHCKHCYLVRDLPHLSLNPAPRSLLHIPACPDVTSAWTYRAWHNPGHCVLQPWSPCVPPTISPTFPDPAWGCRLSPTADSASAHLTELLPPTQTQCPHGTCAGPSKGPCPSSTPTETRPASPPASWPSNDPNAKHSQVAHGAHTSSDPCPRSLKIPVCVLPALQAAEAAPRAAGLMRNAWDPHLVAIEPGAALGRE